MLAAPVMHWDMIVVQVCHHGPLKSCSVRYQLLHAVWVTGLTRLQLAFKISMNVKSSSNCHTQLNLHA